MIKKSRYQLALIPFALAVLPPITWAQDSEGNGITVVPTLGFQWKNLDLSQRWTSKSGLTEKGGIDTTLPTYSAGVTFALNRWSLSVKYEDVLESTSARSDVPLTNTTYPQFFDPAPDPKVNADVERSDLSITLNYNVWQDLSLFAGYTEGETILTPDKVVCDNSTSPDFVCNVDDESNVPYLTQYYVPGSSTYRQEYREDGWFFGANYAWYVGPGAVSVSAAYANMDGRYTDNFGDAAATPADVRLANLSGDSTGTSFAIRWSAPISDRVSYFFDLRQQNYDLDAKSGLVGAWREESVAEVQQKEKLTGFTMGINLAF